MKCFDPGTLFSPPAVATPQVPAAQAPATAAPPRARIRVPVSVVAGDGTHLVTLPQDLVQEASPLDQARSALDTLLTLTPRAPLTSPIPQGTTLLGLYATDAGEVYVDLGGDIARLHPGGTLRELLPQFRSFELGIHAVYPSRQHVAPKVRVLVDYLQRALRGRDWS